MSPLDGQRRVVVRVEVSHPLGAAAVVALEDYARELTRAAEARVAADSAGRTLALELEAPLLAPRGALLEDIEAFARDLAEHDSGGLGWS